VAKITGVVQEIDNKHKFVGQKTIKSNRGQVRYSCVVSLSIEHVIIIGKPYIVELDFI